jgi:hypothetical protein
VGHPRRGGVEYLLRTMRSRWILGGEVQVHVMGQPRRPADVTASPMLGAHVAAVLKYRLPGARRSPRRPRLRQGARRASRILLRAAAPRTRISAAASCSASAARSGWTDSSRPARRRRSSVGADGVGVLHEQPQAFGGAASRSAGHGASRWRRRSAD